MILAQIRFKLLYEQAKFPTTLESKWPKWPWSSRSMTPIFDTRQEYPIMHIWCNLVIPVRSYFHRQAEFPRILSQNGQHDLENQGQWLLFSIPAQSIPGCMFGANLVILAQICEDLLTGQIKFPEILSQNSQNDLEAQGQWPSFSIPDKSIPICMFGANLVIPSQICVILRTSRIS